MRRPGGLHGVGSSVVNALSAAMEVEVARDRVLWKQSYARGKPTTKLINAGPVHNRRGTSIRFKPDPTMFGGVGFSPARLYRLCRSKAYLFRGVQIRWACDAVAAAWRQGRHAGRGGAALPGRPARQPGGGYRRGAVGSCRSSGQARRTCPAAPAGWNGPPPGWRRARGSSTPTATPSRPRRAARTRPGFALRC